MIVVVETEVVVDMLVLMDVVVVVTIRVLWVAVRISVFVVAGAVPLPPPPLPWFNLYCAPVKRPIKTELSSRSTSTRTRSILLSALRGSCTTEEMRCVKDCSGGCVTLSFWRRGAFSVLFIIYQYMHLRGTHNRPSSVDGRGTLASVIPTVSTEGNTAQDCEQ